MNPKFLLALALVLSGGLIGCSTTGQAMTMKVITNTTWTARTNALYSLAGTVRLVNTKESVYTFQFTSAHTGDIPVAVLVNDATKTVWAGRKAEFYIETDSGIVGIRDDVGVLQWDSGLITKLKPGETLDDAVHRFETEVDHPKLGDPPTQWIEIRRVLNPWFFTNPEGSSRPWGGSSIKKFAINKGELQLDLESPTGIYKTSVWIDIKTRNIVKAIENGQQVFPK
jgi:hypothetical protein